MNWWNVRSSCGLPVARAIGRCVGAAGRSVAVRIGRVIDGARQRLEGGAIDVLGGREGHRLGRPAVVAVAERQDRRAAGRDPRELHGRLDRLRARVRQERLPRTAGQQPLEPVVQPQAGLVIHDVLLAVQELGRLLGDRGRHPRMGVARVRDPDPGRVVEVALAVAGDQPGSLATVHVQVRDPAPDGRHDGMVGQGRGGRGGIGGEHGVLRISGRGRGVRLRCWQHSRGPRRAAATAWSAGPGPRRPRR